MLNLIVVAGGKATRMGPWAPQPKPFLGIGPWDPVLKQGKGPCNVDRALHNLTLLSEHLKVGWEHRSALHISVPENLLEHATSRFRQAHVMVDGAAASPLLGPLSALRRNWLNGVVLHNGDDLISRDSILEFAEQVHEEQICLLAVHRVQRGQFGMVTPANTIDEKPILASGWIGAGLIYLPAWACEYAEDEKIQNVSILINECYNKLGRITRIIRTNHPWATIGNPEEYLAACADPYWAD